ncbi:VWA domain-containing protein [Clostridiaceae bacterium HFYG-1003]|nr:VWA domain-containing protein [Clostridiaceae bacterium HFYG-1003]
MKKKILAGILIFLMMISAGIPETYAAGTILPDQSGTMYEASPHFVTSTPDSVPDAEQDSLTESEPQEVPASEGLINEEVELCPTCGLPNCAEGCTEHPEHCSCQVHPVSGEPKDKDSDRADLNDYTPEQVETFTKGLIVNGKLITGIELKDYLFQTLKKKDFPLAINQMNKDQAGSLEGLVSSHEGTRIVEEMVHPGFISNDYSVSKMISSFSRNRLGLLAAAPVSGPVWPNEGAILLDKKAVALPDDLWEVTLKIQGKNYKTTSDVVLIIDNSNSMYNDASRIKNTKIAAKEFGEKLLKVGSTTRLAVVVYGSGLVDSTVFFDSATKTQFTQYIDSINQNGYYANNYDSGGTNIQAGLHEADRILYSAQSTGKLKNIVLLSDGEPTFSYEFTGSASYVDCTAGKNHKTDHSGGYFTNIRMTADYTRVAGSGSSFYVSSNTSITIRCNHNVVRTYKVYDGNSAFQNSGGNNGMATIWEANQTKAKGTTVYSIALQAGTNGEAVLKAVASDGTLGKGYFRIAANETNVPRVLTNAFASIAGSIAIAASNSRVTDPMGDKVALEFSGASPVSTNDLTVYRAGLADVYLSQGSLTYDPVTRSILWQAGNVNEGNDPTMIYRVGVRPGVTILPGEIVDTNKETTFEYTDYLQNPVVKEFPLPKVNVGGGTILVHWYRVNELGEPVNSEGLPVEEPQFAQQIQPADYFEFNGTSALNYNTSYIVTAQVFADYEYREFIWNDLTGSAPSVSVTIPAGDSSQEVWFGYYLDELSDLRIVKTIVGNETDPEQKFLFQVTGTDAKTAGIDLTVSLSGNSELLIKDLPKGNYTVRELTEWSWRYTPDQQQIDVATNPRSTAEVSFRNQKTSDQWLSGDSWIRNIFQLLGK